MRNIKLLLEYDGTDFCGWQIQPNVRTVQGELEAALAKLTRTRIGTITAGRTDSGVHALGQVVNFKTESHLPLHVFKLGLNPLLPRDVRVIEAEQVDMDFHSRFSARRRSYQFRISTRQCAVGRQYTWYCPHELDVELMNEACQLLAGDHDFRSFCQSGSDVEHHLCTIIRAEWSCKDDLYFFDITANRYLHNMVRILVGTITQIGRNLLTVDEFKQILAAKDRRYAGPTAPPQGLFLIRVAY